MSKINSILNSINEESKSDKEVKFFNLIEKVFGFKLMKDDVVSQEQFKKYGVQVDSERNTRISFTGSTTKNMSKTQLRLTPDRIKILSDNNVTLQVFSEEDGLHIDVDMA